MKPKENEESSTTTFDSSSEPMMSSSESQEKRKRGRPKKTEYHPQPQYNPIYNTPLGYQYAPPRTFPITMGYNNSLYRPPMFRQYPEFNPYRIPPGYPGTYIHNITMPYSYSVAPKHQPKPVRKIEEPRRKRRSAAIAKELPTPKEEFEETAESEEYDRIEKLLDYNEEEDTYYVKFRQKSYLHCEWLKREEIAQTRAGLIKIKRFKPRPEPFDPEFVKVDRVLHEDVDEEGRFFLIKWKNLAYEFATFESEESIKDAENFREELEAYYERRKAKPMKMSLEWRPSREYFLKFKESPVFKGGNMLRAYQIEGLNWLLSRWYYKQSCIMADEMGLGKTVQSVAFINTLFECYNYTAPVLIISPLSTLINWEREFKSWTNLRILTFHGSIQGRERICEYEFYLQKNGVSTNIRLFDVLITTYETVMASIKQLQEFDFAVGIFDEAHRLKNSSSKAVSAVKSLNFEHKVLLSGTPLQNNLNELWSLLNFINPVQFSSLQNFLEEFRLEKMEDVERLQNLLRPLMLRRMKEDVEKSIPLKEETIIEVELTMIQKRYYRAILEKNMEFLKKGGSDVAPNLLNAMMELRKCCIHPYLIKGAEESIISDYQKRKASVLHGGSTGAQEVQAGAADPQLGQSGGSLVDAIESNTTSRESIKIVDSNVSVSLPIEEYYKILIQSSGKLVLLDKLLQKLKDNHKVLIFSQMTRCLDLLSEYLSFRKYKYERIDGAVRGENRQAAIDRFSTTDVFVFLLCTKAGGVGINLTAADTVIIFDSDWNPQNDLQAQARCHRIGQTSEVKVYRLITRNTYEREMFDKAGLKLGLDRAVLQKMSYDNKDHKMKKKDAVEILLKKGAYGVLMETDEASRKFCEEDIDQILERRTKIIRHQDGGNVFSKASFQVEEEIDDPDFWENLLSKKEKAENEGRIKRQMRRVAREGVLSREECERVDALISQLTEAIDARARTDGADGAAQAGEGTHRQEGADGAGSADGLLRDKCLLVFLTLLRKGIKALSSLKFDTKNILLVVYQHCLGRISNKKQAEDMTLNMESFVKKPKAAEEGEEASAAFASALGDPLYAEFGVKMLLRVQVPFILQSLLKVADLNLERTRGWSTEDDKRLVNWVLSYGYDNYPTGLGTEKGLFRGKTSEDLNQRVRKIILSLKQKSEEEQNTEDPALITAILSFGRVTEKNAAKLTELLGEEKVEEMRSLVSKICVKKSRRKRESDNELLMYDRIVMFDRFNSLEVMPTVKRLQGMPRKWKVEDDMRLQELVETQGLTEDVLKELGINEEIALKRIEALVNTSVEDDD